MQFLTNLFGNDGGTLIGAVLALGIVLVLIVLAVWALKFTFQASGNVARARNRRLALVESLPVDTKRQLLIVRRDNVEHVILTGGPQDVVVETGIAVEKAAVRHPPVVPAHPVSAPLPAAPHPVAAHALTPASVTAHAPAAPPAPAAAEVPAAARASRTAVERLREFTRPISQRSSTSLRHTGLMRPGSRSEVIPGYLAEAPRDSAKPAPLAEAKGGSGSEARDGINADGS
jgi:flagellar protein FliO/FliZ